VKNRLVAVVVMTLWATVASAQTASMTAHFINIGQGQSVLLEFPCGAVLIDAGAQDAAARTRLIAYLNTFFARRTDLHRSLKTILITHDHIDHDAALRAVVENFPVEHFVDNGLLTGPGAPNPTWVRSQVTSGLKHLQVEEVLDSEVEAVADKAGFTDPAIDAVNCGTVDPEIRVLQGRIDPNPGWTADAFSNLNNHSLVTRVDFNGASLLFMGDLEEDGIQRLLNYYSGPASAILDADVLQVGHHGSNNATTQALLDAVTPNVAVINVGRWNWGSPNTPFTTFLYGHPRQSTLDLLQASIGRKRSQPKSVMAADSSKHFHSTTVSKAIYATGWDGTVRVVVKGKNDITVYREQ
jgi:beta-lactamase superfamily II metal-dependent hydrolase